MRKETIMKRLIYILRIQREKSQTKYIILWNTSVSKQILVYIRNSFSSHHFAWSLQSSIFIFGMDSWSLPLWHVHILRWKKKLSSTNRHLNTSYNFITCSGRLKSIIYFVKKKSPTRFTSQWKNEKEEK